MHTIPSASPRNMFVDNAVPEFVIPELVTGFCPVLEVVAVWIGLVGDGDGVEPPGNDVG